MRPSGQTHYKNEPLGRGCRVAHGIRAREREFAVPKALGARQTCALVTAPPPRRLCRRMSETPPANMADFSARGPEWILSALEPRPATAAMTGFVRQPPHLSGFSFSRPRCNRVTSRITERCVTSRGCNNNLGKMATFNFKLQNLAFLWHEVLPGHDLLCRVTK